MILKRCLILFVLLLCSSAAFAALPTGLVDDLAPIDGVVIQARGGEVLIDAAAIKGVRVGDLFAIAGTREKIVHPQTGELLGEMERSGGLLQVIEVRSGFSVTRQLAGEPPAAGAGVRRNSSFPALLLDTGSGGEGLAAELRTALPGLDWQPYKRIDAQQVNGMYVRGSGIDGLTFLLKGSRLELRGPDFALLRSYDNLRLTPLSPSANVQPEAAPHPGAVPVPVMADPVAPAADAFPAAAPVTAGLTATWSGLAASGQPIDLVVADLDGDGKQEIARLFDDRLEIGRLTGENYVALSEIDVDDTPLALAALDLNANGRPELFVTIADDTRMQSSVYEYQDGVYQEIADNQRWFLNVVTLPDEGTVLLGQARDRSLRGFAPDIVRLAWRGSDLVAGKTLSLPDYATIYSLTALGGDAGQRLARINDGGYLEVFSFGGEPLWSSGDSGASETGFEQPDPQSPHGVDAMINTTYLPTPLVAAGPGRVLTVMNTGLTGSGLLRQMSKARVELWNWDGIEMKPALSQELDGYIPAVQLADADNDGRSELVALLALPNSNPFASRKSQLRLYSFK